MLDKAIRAELVSDALYSGGELLDLLRLKVSELEPLIGSALQFASRVNFGDGQIDSLTIDYVSLDQLAITNSYEMGKKLAFEGELFHFVEYTAEVSIEDDDFLNTIEETVHGETELSARILFELDVESTSVVNLISIDYDEGLEIQMTLRY